MLEIRPDFDPFRLRMLLAKKMKRTRVPLWIAPVVALALALAAIWILWRTST